MHALRKRLLTVAIVLMVFTLACEISLGGGNEEEKSPAEETLQAIYIEQTIQAQVGDSEASAADEATAPTATVEIKHSIIPDNPGWVSQWWLDTSSKNTASQKRANGGDYLNTNLLERPFTANEMVYRADIDLIKVELSQDQNFYYFLLHMSGPNPDSNQLEGWYGVEFDLNRDGRGDRLLWAKADGNTEWNIDDVFVYEDKNQDVGGARPLGADAPNYNGDSYETTVFSLDNLSDPDAAWKRTSPNDARIMQFAIKKALLNNASVFMWSGWADDGVKNPANFDYNDFFTPADAGSPIGGAANYPLKELYLTDNTCRLPYGFDATGNEPGVCYTAEVDPTDEPTATPPCNCDDYANQTYINDEACCTYCGFNWSGTQEFPKWVLDEYGFSMPE